MNTLDPSPVATDDAALLQAFCERNDRQAMNTLFARHADAAYRVALRCCRNSADAEDAVQTAFIEVLRHAAKYRGESAVRGWIFGFVVNACRHKAREEGRRAAREEKAASTGEAHAPERELQESVRTAVQRLPEHYRLPVWLHYCEGLTSGEVAEALSLSENTVRSQLSRGVDELRGALATSGLALAGVSLVGTLATVATESAPATLTASLPGLASTGSGVAAAKAGILAKVAAGTVAAAAMISTAAALWWGERPEDPRPPEFARIEQRVREWQPRPEERRIDEIAWVDGIDQALVLAGRHKRPVFLVTHVGRLGTGRTDGGSLSLRGGPLSKSDVIQTLNTRFVPVYMGSAEKNPELRRIQKEAGAAGLVAGTETIYIVGYDDKFKVLDSIHMCKASEKVLHEKFAKYQAAEAGAPLVEPAPQSRAPYAERDCLVVHLTSRYLNKKGEVLPYNPGATYQTFPAEEWLVLSRREWWELAPPDNGGAGTTWAIDPALATELLCRFYPLTGNFGPAEKNVIQAQELTATVVAGRRTTAWIRLQGRVKLRHTYFSDKDERLVDAELTGFVEYDRSEQRIQSLRLVTETATYGKERFGVAVRSVP